MRRTRIPFDPFGTSAPLASRAFIGSLISGGLGLIGGIIGNEQDRKARSKANYANELRYREAKGLHDEQRRIGEGYVRQAEGYNTERLESARAASRMVRNETEGVGRAAYQNLVDREKASRAGAGADLQRRGLGNSTALDAANRGIAETTNRAMAELSERIALLRTGAIQSSADILHRALGSAMDFSFNAGQFRADLIQRKINTIIGRSDVANPNAGAGGAALGQLGGLLGGLYNQGAFNGLFGSGGGGAGGFVPGVSPFL